MSEETQQGGNWIASNFKTFEQSLNGEKESSIHKLRKDAFSRFEKLGFPTGKNEAWKYTNVSRLSRANFRPPGSAGEPLVTAADLEMWMIPEFEGRRLVFVNGEMSEQLSNTEQLGSGMRVRSLSEVLRGEVDSDRALVEDNLGQQADFREEAFVALNTAFVRDGALIVFENGADCPDPIELVFVTTDAGREVVTHPRVLVIAEPGSRGVVVERFIGAASNEYLTSVVTEVVVKQNAAVDHYRLIEEGAEATHISSLQAYQERDSRFNAFCFSLGGRLVRNDVGPVLDGEGIFSGLYGLSVLSGQQHVDNHTVLEHAQPNCESNELYKGIYGGKSKGVFNGTIIVLPDAQKTNAIQSNQSLLLSPDATSNSKPQLKIWADDVRCTHGATVGQLDDDALFYLQSRGINAADARLMLIKAFASEVLSAVTIDSLKAYLERVLPEKLAEATA